MYASNCIVFVCMWLYVCASMSAPVWVERVCVCMCVCASSYFLLAAGSPFSASLPPLFLRFAI